jgi:hypothetical protein
VNDPWYDELYERNRRLRGVMGRSVDPRSHEARMQRLYEWQEEYVRDLGVRENPDFPAWEAEQAAWWNSGAKGE